ncbi:MAG: AMP-binding protein [Proteobacteria bacterium]|nr:AMP-binding protein [Pseudomonadota bacterium]
MSIERPWLAQYPEGVPAQIDVDEFPTVVSVLESAIANYRDRPAFANLGKTLTYGDIDELSRQFAAYLLGELKLKQGERVAIMMPNCLQYPIATFGVLRAGLTVVNTNPMYTARELRHQLVDSGASAILVLDNFGATVQEVIGDTQVRQVITTGLGDMLGAPKGAIVNFVLRHVKQMVPDYELPGAIRFKQALARGRRALGEPRFGRAARRALGAFEQPPPLGIAVASGRGRRYTMYSFAPQLRIYNGELQALIGLRDVARISRSRRAQRLYERGEPGARRSVRARARSISSSARRWRAASTMSHAASMPWAPRSSSRRAWTSRSWSTQCRSSACVNDSPTV